MVIDFRTGLELNPVTPLLQTVKAGRKTDSNPQASKFQADKDSSPVKREDDKVRMVASAEQAIAAADTLNDFARRVERDLHFSVHKASGKLVIQVINSNTQEIIREIPPEEILKLAEFLAQSTELTSTGVVEEA
jgi:flagellar protein FlaG